MTREELRERYERRIREFYAHERGIDPSGKAYEESKLGLELLEQRPAHDGWHKYPDEKPQDEDLEYIICVSGKIGNIEYDHAVLMGDNYFEDGKWYIHGLRKEGVTVLAWMEPPEPYTDDVSKVMDKQRAIAIEDLAEEQESYIDITGGGPVPMAQWYAIEHAIDDMKKLDKIETIVKNVMLAESCYNAIVEIKDVLGLSR